MHKFRMIRRPLLSALVLPVALVSLSSSAFAADDAPAGAKAAPVAATAAPEAKKAEAAPAGEEKEATAEEAAPVAAEPTEEEREAAKTAFEAGQAAYAEGKFAEALAEFKKAYAIPSPHAEYWIASSMDKADPEAKKAKDTVAAYETFLSNPGAGHVGDKEVAEAKSRVEALNKGLPAKVTIVSTPAGATVTVDGVAQEGVTPLSLELKDGAHKVEIALEGYDPAAIDVAAKGGSEVEQQITLNETPAPAVVAAPVAATAAAPAEPRSMVPAYVTLGLGGAGLISGTIFGIMALNSKSKYNENPNVEDADATERNALIADMSFGIALTLGITGIVLLTADDEPDATTAKAKPYKKQLMVAPYASPKGGGAAARLTF